MPGRNIEEAHIPLGKASEVITSHLTTHHEQQFALEKRTLRKIDLRLLPLMFITYNLNFMDKTILSSASVFGLRTDTHLVGTQYAWLGSAFYFGYMLWAYPTSMLIPRVPLSKYVGINTLFWGAVVALMGACNSFAPLVVLRVFLGVAEATISPAFLFVTSAWYTRSEVPTRVGVWFAGNSLGGIFASFIAFGLGHVEKGMASWRWLFVVLGIATFLWGVPMLLFLPDSIASAKFLTAEEKECALQRVEKEGTGSAGKEWKAEQAWECLRDPKSMFFFCISLLTQLPNGGTQNFQNLVLKGFGFTSLQTTLVTLPASVIAFTTIFVTGRLAGKFANISLYLIGAIVLFPLTGSAIIYSVTPSRGVKLFGYYLMSTGPGALPLSLSLVGVNYKGSSKKMTMTALLFVAYCTGNLAGPQFFKENEAPHYPTAFRGIMICYALVILVAMTLRMYLARENRKKDKTDGVTGSNSSPEQTVEHTIDDDELTDWNARGFRYRM
ncbi:putative allantoate permease [Pseudovirgaria hyperparasitica]|uniref:Putative allantoate permease n=1 Tax=Pseudovirgaria hyperparasitica TaxID=470096 RepID=A0A6A6VWC6_9PEZI|nr:putative allantoate permease [Pseudovirgaria hyperparasitica]KAF2753541.1 putative allantoate permease [Pseudovirgaria hyperparasitica]